ncbi:SAM hydrolase/SAM-dependent halogenase family protein [Oceanibacterium hippocampi]|uniref:S-adenosyl-l-methionine hydroxide adenosyltransferase n=1 Tax=Oceanibacterium hippocampi TaxID=745714 RepID=A0A1Y5RVG2_9PROT|nr:SAM-dependent chlorinase/fluorinase [Oceanibacterium hippocampi]SLN25408.1 S-adenosyl-l-methionine hydroxide adenosyltransferase [Oceanibacterium hippocampi]
MIFLVTDFGLEGPYVGQMKAVLASRAPGVPVIDLFADAPAFRPRPSAYLLAAYAAIGAPGSVFLAVVDPGVGSERAALFLQAGGRWFVGPDNGLLAIAARAGEARVWRAGTNAAPLSATFHGRDLFAPLAADLALGRQPDRDEGALADMVGADWPDDLAEIVYLDHYGNGMTGIRAATLGPDATVEVAGQRLGHARTFSDVAAGAAFWYGNANGLVEIAVSGGRADAVLGLEIGMAVTVGIRP